MADENWVERFAGLSRLPDELQERLVKNSKVLRVPPETLVFGPGKPAENLLLILEGTVRVQQLSEAGREIVLYRIRAGESCVLTTACLLAYESYSAEGITETEVVAAAIPRKVFDDLVSQSRDFRDFVFSAYSKRITDLFHVIEEIAFQRMDIRLADKLIKLGGESGFVRATHQQLAAELGTAREVVSRQLGEFRRRGWVEAGRGSVTLTDRVAMERLATTH